MNEKKNKKNWGIWNEKEYCSVLLLSCVWKLIEEWMERKVSLDFSIIFLIFIIYVLILIMYIIKCINFKFCGSREIHKIASKLYVVSFMLSPTNYLWEISLKYLCIIEISVRISKLTRD